MPSSPMPEIGLDSELRHEEMKATGLESNTNKQAEKRLRARDKESLVKTASNR